VRSKIDIIEAKESGGDFLPESVYLPFKDSISG
jgi:hypothetical protein